MNVDRFSASAKDSLPVPKTIIIPQEKKSFI